MTTQEKLADLYAMEASRGFFAIDERRVNIEDLIESLDGRHVGIVRCYGDPREAITHFWAQGSITGGCIAGWISEEA